MSISIRTPFGFRHPVNLHPAAPRFSNLNGKRIIFFYSWQDGTLYDGPFSDQLEELFIHEGVSIERVYKRRAFDQNDAEERAEIAQRADALIYFGASSCSTSKYTVVYGGYLESEHKKPVVSLTYDTFAKDCKNANHNAGTNTRTVFTTYPADYLAAKQIQEIFAQLVAAFCDPLTDEEKKTGKREFKNPESLITLDSENAAHKWLYNNHKTDGNPVILPTEERVNEMKKGTSLNEDEIIAQRVWPDTTYATVDTIAVVAVMAGLSKESLPAACALAKAYSDCPGQAMVISTNSFAFVPIFKGDIVKKLKLNYQEHAMSPVPGHLNAALGRFLHLLQITIGGWKQGENAFGVIGNPMLGSPAIAENPDYSPAGENSVSLMIGGWSFLGNYMNMDFQQMIDMAKNMDYQIGLVCIISPKRADELKAKFGSLEEAGAHFQQESKVPLKDFWDKQDWQKVFTKPQLELGSRTGEIGGYPKEYLRYFEDPDKCGTEMVPAFPKNSIKFVTCGGSASKMLRAMQGILTTKVDITKYQ